MKTAPMVSCQTKATALLVALLALSQMVSSQQISFQEN
jgi:hypothetical protein